MSHPAPAWMHKSCVAEPPHIATMGRTPLTACICRDNAADQRCTRHALVFWTGRRQALAFTAWQHHAICKQQLNKNKMQRAAALRSKQTLAAAFKGWIEGEAPNACRLPQQAMLLRPHVARLPAGQLCPWRSVLVDSCPALEQAPVSNACQRCTWQHLDSVARVEMGAAPQEQVVALRPAALGGSSTCRARLCATLRRCIAGSVRQQQKQAALSKATAFWGRSALASSFRCWTEGVAEVQRQRAACAIIESAWAAHQQRRRFTAVLGERTAAALLAQRLWRGRQARRRFVATRAAVCLAQRRWRGLTARRHARQLLAQQQARQAAARQQAKAACAIQRAFRVLLARQQLKALAEQRARAAAAAAALVLQRHACRWLARQQPERLSTAATTVGQCQAEAQLERSASNSAQAAGRAGHLLTEQLQAAAGSADHAAARPGTEAAADTKDSPPAEALLWGARATPPLRTLGQQ